MFIYILYLVFIVFLNFVLMFLIFVFLDFFGFFNFCSVCVGLMINFVDLLYFGYTFVGFKSTVVFLTIFITVVARCFIINVLFIFVGCVLILDKRY